MTNYTKEEVDDLRRMVLDDYFSQSGLTEFILFSTIEDRVRTYIAAGVRACPRGRSYDLQPHSSQTLTGT